MASTILLKKQEESNARRVRDLLRLPENKKCFDCPIKSPFFVNVTLSTFVCTRCSGLVREVGHRVKSISASTFTGPELLALELGGNGTASKIWLSCGYNTVDTPEPESDGEVRGFMRQKYYERKWLNYDLAVSHDLTVKDRIKELFTEDGLPKQQPRARRSTMGSNTTTSMMAFDLQQNTRLGKTIPTSLDLSSTNKVHPPTIQTAPLIMNPSQLQPKMTSPNQPKVEQVRKTPDTAPVSPLPTQQPASPMGSFFTDLAGLTLSDTPAHMQSHTHLYNNHQSKYSSGILTPTSWNKINTLGKDNTSNQHDVQPTATYSVPHTMSSDDGSSSSNHKRASSLQDTDPYSALHTHHTQNQQRYQQTITAINAITPASSSSTQPNHNLVNKKQEINSCDPYAALRQLSDGPDRLSPTSPPITSNTAKMTHHITNTNWASQPSKQQHEPGTSFIPAQNLPRQDKSYGKKNTDEWVQAGLHLATGGDNNDEDVMTQASSSFTSYSGASSTTSRKPDDKAKISNAFSDLDPLVAYKQNRTTAPSFVLSNP